MPAHQPVRHVRRPRLDTARLGQIVTDMDVLATLLIVAVMLIMVLIQTHLAELRAVVDHWRSARF